MQWLQNLDTDLFRWINLGWSNPVLDKVMPFFSGNALFAPVVVLLVLLVVWKGGLRGGIFVLMLALVVAIGDGLICNTLKHAIGRSRPFLVLGDAHVLVGRSGSGSMPSSHAANWFSATMVALIYYRRSLWIMLPTAVLVGLSRIYNGVHYPSDVLVGAILGAGYAAAVLWLVERVWAAVGQRWFPLWWRTLPSLVNLPANLSRSEKEPGEEELAALESGNEPAETARMAGLGASARESGSQVPARFSRTNRPAGTAPELVLPARKGIASADFRAPHLTLDTHWLHLGYLFTAIVLVARLLYIHSGTIQLAEDEAYQWLWSKHLALSYYSKPPLIALTQFLGTYLWGDSAFGVRFFSPLIAAGLSVLMLRFFAREFNARAGFFLLLILTATPLMAVGSVLMTVDPLSVLFWTLAMVSGWRAVQARSSTADWLLTGLWLGLGFLSKYTALFQLLSFVLFFCLWAPARKQLRRPGPYLALLVMGVCSLPVLIWNAQHGWVTAVHVADDAGWREQWHPTFRYLGEFIGSEAGLLNPVFFVGMLWAAVAFWRKERRNPKLLFLFSMGGPVFLAYFCHSFYGRVLPNWIAPSVVPLFGLMVAYWDTRWRLAAGQGMPTRASGWLACSLLLGFTLVLAAHNTDVVRKVTGRYLPVKYDPLHRVRQWSATAEAVESYRARLESEGKPAFIIANHYGLTGQISFYLPEAREKLLARAPLVYCRSTEIPENQFYFWPGYEGRKGENAVYVIELSRDNPDPVEAPARLEAEFESVDLLGVTNVMYHGYLLRPLEIFACRGLR